MSIDQAIGAVPPYIYADIGGDDRWTWFVRSPASHRRFPSDPLRLGHCQFAGAGGCLSVRGIAIRSPGAPLCRVDGDLLSRARKRGGLGRRNDEHLHLYAAPPTSTSGANRPWQVAWPCRGWVPGSTNSPRSP
jgi:hypothetical protein